MSCDDIGIIGQASKSKGGLKSTAEDKGQKREYLKIFETLPPQMLNAYGPAKFAKLSDELVWKHFNQPLKSGGPYMTEFCSKEAERRGIGANRWLHAVMLFCQYQMEDGIKKQNEGLLIEEKCAELYAEIERILPSLEYCLAPKKVKEQCGASSLRSSGVEQKGAEVSKDEVLLDKHSKTLYEWLDVTQVSRVRMLMQWHSAAGLSYVAAVHHRAAQCFRYHGNKMHGEGAVEVSLIEFQECIKTRHRAGSRGAEEAGGVSSATDDFK